MSTETAISKSTNGKSGLPISMQYTDEQKNIIKSTVAKNTTDMELLYFLELCKAEGLSPFKKQIWCYKDSQNNLIVFAGRDGFLFKAQENPNYAGIRSADVCENDDFVFDVINPENNRHIINHKNRGKTIGGYAIVYRKDGQCTPVYVNFDEYNKKRNTWLSNPSAMIKKVAETSALKLAFGIPGVQSEHEFEIINDVAIPIDHTEVTVEFEAIIEGISQMNDIDELNNYFNQLDQTMKDNLKVKELFREAKNKFIGKLSDKISSIKSEAELNKFFQSLTMTVKSDKEVAKLFNNHKAKFTNAN